MSKAEVGDLVSVCPGFPELPSPEVLREAYLHEIEQAFSSGHYVVTIEGQDGIGKTTLLSQFARRHPDHAFSLFIKPTSRLAYAPEFVQLALCDQLHWALFHELFSGELSDPGFLPTHLPVLLRQARKTKWSCT